MGILASSTNRSRAKILAGPDQESTREGCASQGCTDGNCRCKELEEKQHLLEAVLRKFKKISMLHHDSKFKAVRDAEVERWFMRMSTALRSQSLASFRAGCQRGALTG